MTVGASLRNRLTRLYMNGGFGVFYCTGLEDRGIGEVFKEYQDHETNAWNHLRRTSPSYAQVYAELTHRCTNWHIRMGLVLLFLEGKLFAPGAKDNTSLANQLRGMMTDSQDGVNQNELISSVIFECAIPAAIRQGAVKSTCAPTALAIHTAIVQPAEYGRIVRNLASKAKCVTLRRGGRIDRNGTGLGLLCPAPYTNRDANTAFTMAQAIWQPTFMDHYNGAPGFDARSDTNTLFGIGTGDGNTGLFDGQIANALNDLTGVDWTHSSDKGKAVDRQHRSATGNGWPTIMNIDVSGTPHSTVVVRIDKAGNTVYGYDPNDGGERLTLDVARNCRSYIFPKAYE